MTNVGEETSMERPSDGAVQIKSHGLSVYVEKERITFDEQGRWHNATGDFCTLEEAVTEAVNRYERSKGTKLCS